MGFNKEKPEEIKVFYKSAGNASEKPRSKAWHEAEKFFPKKSKEIAGAASYENLDNEPIIKEKAA